VPTILYGSIRDVKDFLWNSADLDNKHMPALREILKEPQAKAPRHPREEAMGPGSRGAIHFACWGVRAAVVSCGSAAQRL
jgi:hypothetical protein